MTRRFDSLHHRSSFLAESFAIGLSRQLTQAKGETIFDAQLSYDLSNAGVKGLTVYLQGSNLTDEPFVTGAHSGLMRVSWSVIEP